MRGLASFCIFRIRLSRGARLGRRGGLAWLSLLWLRFLLLDKDLIEIGWKEGNLLIWYKQVISYHLLSIRCLSRLALYLTFLNDLFAICRLVYRSVSLDNLRIAIDLPRGKIPALVDRFQVYISLLNDLDLFSFKEL